LLELIDAVEVARAGRDLMEWPIESNVGNGLLRISDVNLGDGCGGLVLQDEVAGAGEGTALGEDVNVGIYAQDLGLRQESVLLEVALVLGLDIAALGGA
jgi:hypothetical protein